MARDSSRGLTLLLVPTELEAIELLPALEPPPPLEFLTLAASEELALAVTGFGLVASAATTAFLLERSRPARCILAGIAGSYDTEVAPEGTVVRARHASVHGIGAGEAADHLSVRELGFPQLPAGGGREAIWDALSLEPLAPAGGRGQAIDGDVLSVTAASASLAEARDRAARTGALIEDMESFSVALACHLTDTPLEILRAVSNRAGERRKEHWCIDEAIAALRAELRTRWNLP